MDRKERQRRGAFFTKGACFESPVSDFITASGATVALDPAAGDGGLARLGPPGLRWALFDAHAYESEGGPPGLSIEQRDTLAPGGFPAGYDLCIMNPPYVSPKRAKALGQTGLRRDLHEEFVDRALAACRFVACILPQSAIRRLTKKRRLAQIVLLPPDTCDGTEVPTVFALFGPRARSGGVAVWRGGVKLGQLRALLAHPVLRRKPPTDFIFNDASGQLGLHAADGRRGTTIRFVVGSEIEAAEVKSSSRHVTRIRLPEGVDAKTVADQCNDILSEIRRATHDLALTPIHGARADGLQRRRLPYALAAKIISLALEMVSTQSGQSPSE